VPYAFTTHDIDQAIYHVANALQIPVLILALLALAAVIYEFGAYLIELGREEEAIEWLERAKTAPRYEPRHYPYLNLAWIYARQHKVREAIDQLQSVIAIEPEHRGARKELHRLIGMLN